MKSILITLIIIALASVPALVYAQTQPLTANAPLSQPLVREGTLATRLAQDLKVGSPASETEAESMLTAAGIAPRNGWIADYPVTPDIVGELQTAIGAAADSGKISMSKDAAMKSFNDTIAGYSLDVTAGGAPQGYGETAAPSYSDPTEINDYYYNEGPPVVTYYAPPPDYAYLYSWVPYPFWGWNFWFPGFFVLADFNIEVHGHHHHGGHHAGGHHGREFISNHFRDHRTGGFSRIDPVNRSHGGVFADRRGTGWTDVSARRGAAAIYNRSRSVSVGTGSRQFTAPSGSRLTNASSNRTFSSAGRMSGGATVRGGRGLGQNAYRTQQAVSPRTYNNVQGRVYNRPVYRSPGTASSSFGGRTFSAPSSSLRSYSAPSVGSRAMGVSRGVGAGVSGGGGSFGAGGRGSFGGGGRR